MRHDIQDQVNFRNELNTITNEVMPILLKHFEQFVGKKILKVNGEFIEKCKIDPLFYEKYRTKYNCRIWFEKFRHDITICVDISRVKNGSCNYYKNCTYSLDISEGVLQRIVPFIPLKTDYSVEGIKRSIEEYKVALQNAENLKSLIPNFIEM